jgi:hypothetical protein
LRAFNSWIAWSCSSISKSSSILLFIITNMRPLYSLQASK